MNKKYIWFVISFVVAVSYVTFIEVTVAYMGSGAVAIAMLVISFAVMIPLFIGAYDKWFEDKD
jgi:hypothetical protein